MILNFFHLPGLSCCLCFMNFTPWTSGAVQRTNLVAPIEWDPFAHNFRPTGVAISAFIEYALLLVPSTKSVHSLDAAPGPVTGQAPNLAAPIAPNFRPMAAPWEVASEKMRGQATEAVPLRPPTLFKLHSRRSPLPQGSQVSPPPHPPRPG